MATRPKSSPEKIFHLLTIPVAPVEIVGYPAGLQRGFPFPTVAISVFDEIYHSMAKETGIRL